LHRGKLRLTVIIVAALSLLLVVVVGGKASELQEVFGMRSDRPGDTDSSPGPTSVNPSAGGRTRHGESERVSNEQPSTDKDLPYLDETVRMTEDDKPVVTNPSDLLVVANKSRSLPRDYVPDDLVVPEVRFTFEEFHPKKQLREDAAEALEKLFAAATDDDIYLFAISGYRSYDTQEQIFQYNVERMGSVEAANRFSARPGESEHQTGLAMDVSTREMGFALEEALGETTAGKWLVANAAQFGFIIRYPEGKENITGYQYEPWHLRYVGEDAACEIMANGLTLEEYLTRPEHREGLEAEREDEPSTQGGS